jgi:hypothetical protein
MIANQTGMRFNRQTSDAVPRGVMPQPFPAIEGLTILRDVAQPARGLIERTAQDCAAHSEGVVAILFIHSGRREEVPGGVRKSPTISGRTGAPRESRIRCEVFNFRRSQ